jgi:hypothetical protein
MDSRTMNEPQRMEAIEQFARVLDTLHISYAIGGSIASSLYGTARFTEDADITIALFSPLADKFYEAVKDDFYISEQAMRQALIARSSFNIIHYKTAFKIDIFVEGRTDFEQRLIARGRETKLADSAQMSLRLVSPEDIVLLKLRWFHAGGCISQRQWSDVLGVLKVQRQALDYGYMKESARELGLAELLTNAISEAEIGT